MKKELYGWKRWKRWKRGVAACMAAVCFWMGWSVEETAAAAEARPMLRVGIRSDDDAFSA